MGFKLPWEADAAPAEADAETLAAAPLIREIAARQQQLEAQSRLTPAESAALACVKDAVPTCISCFEPVEERPAKDTLLACDDNQRQ